MQVDAFDKDTDSEGLSCQYLQSLVLTAVLVPLALSTGMDSQLKTIPILVFKITTSNRFTDNANAESMRPSLEINPRLVKAFGYISLLVKIGTAISEVSTHSQHGP